MNFIAKLKSGLSKSSGKLSEGITGIFTRQKLNAESLEELEELLIQSDMGAKVASEISAAMAQDKFEKDITPGEVREFLADRITAILEPYAHPLIPEVAQRPAVILVVGVNGNGKTTTIGKLAYQYRQQGLTVMLAAADTFRAAAVEQLQQWGERANIPVVTGPPQSDPASVAYNALEKAKNAGVDVLLIDTAGRLHNKANLMAELEKISKVLKKLDGSAPHHVIQVLDATTGQNAIAQVQAFKDTADVTGLIITKLDGTAKGGIVVALARQFGLPIHAVGVGEGIDDLDAFEAVEFSRNLVDITMS
ncbi:MAG: signal recognition particle-docking protein FtsY [Alphaproteobacteria bacterium]